MQRRAAGAPLFLPDKAGTQNTTKHPMRFEAGGCGMREK